MLLWDENRTVITIDDKFSSIYYMYSSSQGVTLCDHTPSSQVNIRLSETDNIWLLDIASTWLDDNTEEAELQRLKNEQYREVSLYQHQQNGEGECDKIIKLMKD